MLQSNERNNDPFNAYNRVVNNTTKEWCLQSKKN